MFSRWSAEQRYRNSIKMRHDWCATARSSSCLSLPSGTPQASPPCGPALRRARRRWRSAAAGRFDAAGKGSILDPRTHLRPGHLDLDFFFAQSRVLERQISPGLVSLVAFTLGFCIYDVFSALRYRLRTRGTRWRYHRPHLRHTVRWLQRSPIAGVRSAASPFSPALLTC